MSQLADKVHISAFLLEDSMRVAIVIAAAAGILLTGGAAVTLSTGIARTPLLLNCVTFDFEAEIEATDRALAMDRSTPDETVEIRALRDEALQIDREAQLLNRTNRDEVQKAVWHRDYVMGRALEKLGVRWDCQRAGFFRDSTAGLVRGSVECLARAPSLRLNRQIDKGPAGYRGRRPIAPTNFMSASWRLTSPG